MKTVSFKWAGQTLHISDSEAFDIAERIEEIITINEIVEMDSRPKYRKLSRAFSEMVNFAGGRSTPKEVHTAMMNEVKAGGPDFIVAALQCLVEILMDGAPENKGEADDDGKKSSSSKVATS